LRWLSRPSIPEAAESKRRNGMFQLSIYACIPSLMTDKIDEFLTPEEPGCKSLPFEVALELERLKMHAGRYQGSWAPMV
jgi:hypothetical protein